MKAISDNSVVGIDPGINGSIVLTDGRTLECWNMPIVTNGKDKDIDFDGIHEILFGLSERSYGLHLFVERAIPMAMGAKSAFNYGRGFAALQIAIQLLDFSVTYVEPQKWAKEMHEGISTDLRPKAKSLIAVKRLYPKLIRFLPASSKGRLHDGAIDALLIAGYGIRKHGLKTEAQPEATGDFY